MKSEVFTDINKSKCKLIVPKNSLDAYKQAGADYVGAVKTSDFMTEEAYDIPWEILQRIMNRIVNEVDHVNRVVYDITSKPPGTIEFE